VNQFCFHFSIQFTIMPEPDFVMHFTDAEVDWRRAQNIKVIMPKPDPPEVQEIVGSNPVGCDTVHSFNSVHSFIYPEHLIHQQSVTTY
jgi:hypothetical protein